MMVIVVGGLALQRNLVAVVILSSVYSFLTATVLVFLDAVDVAMTEAAVGAGLSTVLVLATLYLTKAEKGRSSPVGSLPLIITVIVGAAIAWGTVGFPRFGDPETPMQQHISPYYLKNALQETKVPNVVTAVLASYRGYDTLGETTVIFTAGISVLMLLSRKRRYEETRHDKPLIKIAMEENAIIRILAKLFLPFILLFAFYIQFHGDLGPGGGFQAGVITASVAVIYCLVFGPVYPTRSAVSLATRLLISAGVFTYATVGLLSLIRGKNYLDYSVLHQEAATGQHIGIFIVEWGVFMTVFATMLAIFYAFAERSRPNEGGAE